MKTEPTGQIWMWFVEKCQGLEYAERKMAQQEWVDDFFLSGQFDALFMPWRCVRNQLQKIHQAISFFNAEEPTQVEFQAYS